MSSAVSNPKNLSRCCALLAAGIGAVELSGWIFDIPALQRIHPELVTMKANTAIALILASISLLLLQDEKVTGVKRRTAQLLAAVILTLGLLTLSEYLFGWNLGIDEFFFHESLATAGHSVPGRMGIASTVIFICLGTALLVFDVRLAGKYWAAKLAALAGVATTLVFLYYFYGVQEGEAVPKYAPSALHTVVAFYALCGGIFFARPGRGVMLSLLGPSVGSVVARRMLPTAFFLPILLGWIIILGDRAGLLGLGFGAAAFVVLIILVFTGLIRWTVIAINWQEAERQRAEFALRRSEANLRDFVDNDQFVHTRCFTRDITETREADVARARLAAIVMASNDAIISKSLNGTITTWNPGAERTFGYTEEEMIGQSILRLIPPDLHGEEKNILERLAAGEPIHRYETERVRKDGRRLQVSLTISPIYSAMGTIIGASKIVRDITERKQSETNLRESEERTRMATEATAVGIWERNIQSSAIRWDAQMFRIYGIAPTADGFVKYSDWTGAVLPEDLPETESILQDTIRACGHSRREFRIRRREDGQVRDIEAVETVRTNQHGQAEWVLGTNLDITERRAAEEELRASKEQMAAMNEQLIVSSVRQHELTEAAEKLNAQLLDEITERKNVEEKLRTSERETKLSLEYAEATLRTTPVPFLVLRADLRVNTASEVFYTDFKVSPAETEGRLIYEIGNGQWNIAKLRELLEEIIPKKHVLKGFEVTHEFATIGERTMLLNARRMDNAEGVPERILLAIEDITERRQAEEVQSRMAAIISSADDGILSKALDGVVTTWNASAERLLGYTAEEIIGNPNLHLTPPELHHEEEQILEQILSGKAVENFETELMTKDGSRLAVSLTVSPIMDATGKVVGASKIVRDITERKRAEETLRASQERFRAAAGAVSDIIWTNNADGRMEGEQLVWGAFTGQRREEYEGHGWTEAVHPEDAQPTIDAWNLAVAEKCAFEFEHRVRRHDGEWRLCSIRAVPVLDPKGETREWVGVHTDITERKAAEESLRFTAAELVRSARAKDDFLAALSHELRTPLTPVLMTASALADEPSLPMEVREQLSMMHRNIELEARLIDDLLDLTTISRGKLVLAPAVTDLHAVLGHTHEIIRSDGQGKKVQIELRLEAERHHALVDPTRIQQVFWNLLKNAVKFTPSGGSITVSTRNDAEGKIVLTVADSGVGISAEALPNIFNAFEQGDVAGQHRYGGLGLGLAISKAIMEAHGGAISVESAGQDRGAAFTVALASVDASEATGSDTDTDTGSATGTGPLRLLIVEDHETTRRVLAKLLTRHGHQVTTAGNMREGLTAYAAESFDVVISDLGLPDGSGIDLMREIQRQRPVPAIALSGYGMEDDVRRTREAGFTAHLVKPVNIDQLRRLVEQIALDALRPAQPGQ